MKKMQYVWVFIIIIVLAVLVFAGCKMFSHDPGTTDEDTGTDVSASESVSGETENTDGSTASTGETTAAPTPTTQPGASDTTAPSEGASTTVPAPSDATTTEPAPSDATPSESATAEPSTAAPGPAPAVPTSTEYDYMRSGKFFMRGTMYDGTERNAITLGIGDNLLYMESSMDGVTLGLLQSGKSIYLLAPQKQTYCEVGSILSSILEDTGMLSQEELQQMVDNMGFKEMKPLSEAKSVEDATVNGTPCKAYIYDKEDGGTTRICMNGERLIAVEKYTASGAFDSATYIDEISGTIPTLPPSNYTKQNMLKFMTSMEGLMD